MKTSDPKCENDYQCDEDVRTIERHAEVTADPKRHKKATAKLTQKHRDLGKVVKGLKAAFPDKKKDDDHEVED